MIEVANRPEDLVLTRSRYSALMEALGRFTVDKQLLDFTHFSDTFNIFSIDDSVASYTQIQIASKNFTETCITKKVPIRGAISTGLLTNAFGKEEKILIGPALIDAHDYGEDQNWIGLILTPKAFNRLKTLDLDPNRHDFRPIDSDVMRKFSTEPIYAYRLSRGKSNLGSELLSPLNEMKQQVENLYKNTEDEKYQDVMNMYKRTEEYLKKHYEFV